MYQDELIELILETDTFSEKEKEKFIKLISEDKLTEQDKVIIAGKVSDQEKKDQKEIEKIDNEIIRLEQKKGSYDRFSKKALGKISDLFERETEIRLKKMQKTFDDALVKDAEAAKKEEKEFEKAYQKMLNEIDKKKMAEARGKLDAKNTQK